MKLFPLTVALLATAGVTQLATAQDVPNTTPSNNVSLCVTTEIGSCGTLCEPFQCAPTYTLVSSFETMRFDITTSVDSFYVLVAGLAVPGCLPIPGISGELGLWTPAMTVEFGLTNESDRDFDLICQPAHVQTTLDVPFVQPGYDMRFQVLGVNNWPPNDLPITFSRPVEVRTR
jgi:hypothetical protein